MSPKPRSPRFVESIRSVVKFGPIEWDRTTRRLSRAADIGDLRRLARRRLPRGVFDYIDGAAETESALRRNSDAFDAYTFRPRVMRDMTGVDATTTLLGKEIPLPLVLAPTGFTRIADPEGELAVARAAGAIGLPYALSTLSTRSIEEVAAVATGPLWFQVYTWRDRGLVKSMIERAQQAGYEALVLTVDSAVLGRRQRDVRRGFTLPPKIGLSTIVDGILHPGWTWDLIRSEPISFANVVGHHDVDGSDAVSLASIVNEQFDPTLSWDDLEWMRSVWNGPIVLKGIQTVDDARIAADLGVEAIALSNHGGRQLDDAPAILDLVPPVVDAVGDRTEVICDGGIRRGSDIVKAVALGAKACMAGRAYLYGLGAAGERGVAHALGILDADVRRTMALIGCGTVAGLDTTYLQAG